MLSEHNFNMNHVFNTPTMLGDFAPGKGIEQGYVGTGKLSQFNNGFASGGNLGQSSNLGLSIMPAMQNLQAQQPIQVYLI